MKPRHKHVSITGLIIYSIGIVLGMILCGWFFWGEIEAFLLVRDAGQDRLTTLHCPLMLSSAEMGTVIAEFNNPTAEGITPLVRAKISHVPLMRTEASTITLAPGEKKQMLWTVGPQDVVFNKLILINIFESGQKNFNSHQGSCSIPVLMIPGLPGKWLFIFAFALTVLSLAAGSALWVMGNSSLRDPKQNATSAGIALAVVLILDLLLTLPRWWLPGVFLFFAAIMLIVIIITQFVLFPS